MYLSIEQEACLSEWAIALNLGGVSPTHALLTSIAAKLRNDGRPADQWRYPHKNWVTRFIQRHPALQTCRSKPMEGARIKQVTKASLEDHIDRFTKVISDFDIPSDFWANIDETGMADGLAKSGPVIGLAGRKALVAQEGSRDWKSIIHCIGTNGKSSTPAIIFKGKDLYNQWFQICSEGGIPSWHYSHAEKGFSTLLHLLEWFQKVYLVEFPAPNPNQWRLLIMDGHSTHVDVDFVMAALSNKVFLYYLPPHHSHVAQPLDVGVFGPLKHHYREYYNRHATGYEGAAIEKQLFIKAYEYAYLKEFTPSNIAGAWRKAGLIPLNRTKLLSHPDIRDINISMVRATTPPSNPQEIIAIRTPASKADVIKLWDKKNVVGRRDRLIRRKVLKFVDKVTANAVFTRAENVKLTQALKTQGRKRKRVKKANLNDVFASRLDIYRSQEGEGEGRVNLEAET